MPADRPEISQMTLEDLYTLHKQLADQHHAVWEQMSDLDKAERANGNILAPLSPAWNDLLTEMASYSNESADVYEEIIRRESVRAGA